MTKPLVAIVPVRGGSKGLPGKNARLLAGVALWQRAVDQALAAGAVQVVVTTDIAEILEGPAQDGVTVLARPAELSEDTTPMAPVLMHAIEAAIGQAAQIVLLQATSPLRSVGDIHEAAQLHTNGGYDLVMSVTPTDSGILKYGTVKAGQFLPVSDPAYCFTNRQSLPDVMRPNGAVYVFDRDWYLANGSLATDRIGAHVMPAERSFDIDTDADFRRAEALIAD